MSWKHLFAVITAIGLTAAALPLLPAMPAGTAAAEIRQGANLTREVTFTTTSAGANTTSGTDMPCRFYGAVTVNGANVPDGTVITAILGGDEYQTVTPAVYGPSSYAILIIPGVDRDYPDETTVSFKIGEHIASVQGSWRTGGNLPLDLVVKADLVTPPTPAPTPAPTEPLGPTSTANIRLERGWNLISFDVMPANRDVAAVLASISGYYSVVETIDGATRSYQPSVPPAVNTLIDMDPYHGYWIKMEQAGNLTITGASLEPNVPLTLNPGDNLVSYLADNALPVATALSTIDGRYSAVLGYDDEAVSFYPDLPPETNTLQFLSPGHGYLIVMRTGGTLAYLGS